MGVVGNFKLVWEKENYSICILYDKKECGYL